MMSLDTKLPHFEANIYSQIALNDLVTYAVFFLSQQGGEIIAEDIVVACFKLFPERFQLHGYPQWPDSTVVNKRWVDCRDKGLLQGSTAKGFSLTPKGLVLAEKMEKILTGKQKLFLKPTANKGGEELRTRAGRFNRSLENSDAFQQYSTNGEAAKISEFDFRNMLLCTMESSPSTLRNNLEQFKQNASLYQRQDLLKFLEFCGKTFSNQLSDFSEDRPKYRGGMIKQKIK